MSIMSILEKKKKEKEREARRKTLKKVALGTTVGTAIGAAAGILFAPKAGKELRSEISIKAKDTGKSTKEKLDSVVGSIKNSISEIKNKKDAAVPAVEGQDDPSKNQ